MARKLITLSEAAKFLKVKENIVKEMVNSDVFNMVKSGRTMKIDRYEIEEWLANLSESEEEHLALRRTVCRFVDYIDPALVYLNFEAENKYEAIAEMSKFARERKIVRDHRWLYEVVVAREELVSTAVGKGVALLHPRHMHPTKIKRPCVLFGRCKEGVDFDAIDNKPVNLFFMLLLHNDKQHLFSLSYLSRLMLAGANIERLAQATAPDEVIDVLTTHVWETGKKKK
ncbi:MAG: PTS sugar transporter subunit IIA [Candidatus Cloacimonetes bacterium]|nr:PTS sugar transporter subunit IIA [Candidatus Cloacimonadota bacterium]